MPEATDERVAYYAGLDLGPAGQFTGLAVVEKHYRAGEYGHHHDARYAVRHLARFPPGTSYGEVLDAVRAVVADPTVKDATLVVDQTAVGRAVFEKFRDAGLSGSIRALTVTAGNVAQVDELGGWLVPKKDLVGVLQVLLQERRLKVAPALEHAATLAAELQHFQLKTVPLKPDALEWRERPHDDLVLAVAIAAWLAERAGPTFFVYFVSAPDPPQPQRWWSRW